MSNIINVKFGEARQIELLAKDISEAAQCEPFYISKHNADLLGHCMVHAFKRFQEAANVSITWREGATPDEINAAMQAYAARVQAVAVDEMTKLFGAALTYGCQELPRMK